MPYSNVIEGRMVEVKAGSDVVEGLLSYHPDVGIGFQVCHLFNGDIFSHVHFTRTQKIGTGARLRNRDDDNPVQCRATAMIIFVALQSEAYVRLEFDDLIGAGADQDAIPPLWRRTFRRMPDSL